MLGTGLPTEVLCLSLAWVQRWLEPALVMSGTMFLHIKNCKSKVSRENICCLQMKNTSWEEALVGLQVWRQRRGATLGGLWGVPGQSFSARSFHVIISPRGPVHWLREALIRHGCDQMFYLP